mgnify:CR=1 FL=1
MLVRLSVRNLAVVEETDVIFGSGLNVITGETGAGKSVLMGALRLLLGERADRSAIRTGADEAVVCAVYELDDCLAVNAVLADADLPQCEEGILVLRRVITASGGGRVRVNDAPATVVLLRRLAPLLADIHGPNDHLSLLDGAFQLRLLTAYAGAERELADYQSAWTALQTARRRLGEMVGDPMERTALMERLAYEANEIREVAPTAEDGEELTKRHAAAANAEEILSVGNGLISQLTDGENSIAEQLAAVNRVLHELSRLFPEAVAWGNELSGVQVQIQELSQTMAQRLSQVDAAPDVLESLERRVGQIQRLRRKYGPTVEDVIRHGQEVQAKLDALMGTDAEVDRLRGKVVEAEAEVYRTGMALRVARERAVPALSRAISEVLRDLGFLQASFPIVMIPCDAGVSGMDEVEFRFEPNPGESPRPLADIASSGEIARVMLAVKTILAKHDAIPSLVFDEIDANIGGDVCRRVGEKLRQLAMDRQVICITHQPLTAVFGQTHLRVVKHVSESGRTVTHIESLPEEVRADEIARMLGGGDAAKRLARVLLRSPECAEVCGDGQVYACGSR